MSATSFCFSKGFFMTVIPACLRLRSRRKIALLAADSLTLLGTMLAALALRDLAGGVIDPATHAPLLFFLFVAPCINYFEGLYDAPPPALHEELRSLAVSTSLAYLCVAIFLMLGRGEQPSRLVYLGAWLGSLALVPLVRWRVRRLLSRKEWWGAPTVIFGLGTMPGRLETYLREHPELGLKPAARVGERLCGGAESGFALAETSESREENGCSLPFLDSEKELEAFYGRSAEACALVILSEKNACRNDVVETATRLFSSVILVPESFAGSDIPLWVRPVEIGHIFCLRARQNLLDSRRLFLKRAMDVFLAFTGSLLVLPLCAIIGGCIRLESSGPVFFRHTRIGRGGKPIQILKFRTMVRNASEVLERHLADNPDLRREWEADQKLRCDPRITRVGAFLRKTSLDELPQLWNVLTGEMSLVGPRPIVEEEIVKYGASFQAYSRVRPGITGLWQVSGRNDLSYEARVRIDRYYINNWSTWLDLLILTKTVPVVLGRKGAY